MRNLKRVLSLALASIMLLGMMVVGASAADKTAADLTDMDKVTNKEAVSLMVDLGIIVGKPDGSYAPSESVDRATMAKLITYIMMGDVDASIFDGTKTDLKDIDSSWAKGYINYCYANKYITGDGKGNFFPTQGVTVVQAAKMLLVALGYDAEDRGYQNDASWSVNIMKDAKTKGLIEGFDAKANDPLTRDNAAQMIFNTLLAKTVTAKYDRDMGEKYVSEYVDDDTTLGYQTYSLEKHTGVVVANDFAALMGAVQDTGKTLIYTYNKDGVVVNTDSKSIKVPTGVAMLGQEVNYYTHGSKGTVSSFVSATDKTKTYTYNDNDITYAKFLSNNSITVDGDKYTEFSTNYVDEAAYTPKAADAARFVDSNNDGKVDFVLKTNYTFSKVTKVDSTNITISGLGTRKIADVSGSADLEKDDYVNYANVGTSGKAVAEKAEEITGTVTALKSNKTKAVIDGETYNVAADAGKASVKDPAQVAKTYINNLTISKAVAGIFYLNHAGEIAVYLPTEDAVDSTTLYAYVTGLQVSSYFGDKTVEAKVVLADGTQETLIVVDDSNKNTDGLYDQAAKASDLSKLAGVYPYTLNKDGEMLAGAKVATTSDVKTKYTAGNPKMVLDSTSILLDSNTVVLFYKKAADGKETISSYKGVNNVPGIAEDTTVTYVKADDKTFATFILVSNAVGEVETAEYAYALGNGFTAQTADGYEYSMVVNGVKKTLTTANEVADMHIGDIYTYGLDKDEIATLTKVTTHIATGVITSVTDKYITLKGGEVVELASDYSVDDLTSTDNKNAIIPGTGDLIADSKIVYVTSNSKLVKAYVINDGKVAGVDGENKGVLLAVDGYNVTATGTFTEAGNKLVLKYTAPAGISANGAGIKVNDATVSADLADGKTSVELTHVFTTGTKTITVEIKWNSLYTETYTIDTSDLSEYVAPTPAE